MSTPNFLIIGERRSGTTTLARWMECHPDIYIHPRMDMGYFIDRELVGSKDWNKGHVDLKRWGSEHSKKEYLAYFKDVKEQIVVGEKSADYLFWHYSHERIKSYFPDIKLIVTLRNPVDRAWSMYWNEIGKGREQTTFEEAVKLEEERIKESDYARDHLSYITRGFYDESISRLFEVFNKNNIYILILEKAISNPKKYLKEIYSFLGVNPNEGIENVNIHFNKNWTLVPKPFIISNSFFTYLEKMYFKTISKVASILFRKNIYAKRNLVIILSKFFRYSKSDFTMDNKTKKYLNNLYLPHIKKLEKMIELDLSEWEKE